MIKLNSFIKNHYFLFLILIFASIILSINLDKPFIGHHDYNGAWHSTASRNLVRYGLVNTRFASVLNADYTARGDFQYFTHYPPLLPILIYTSFSIFGVSELSARLIPLIFSLMTILLIYQICLRFFNPRVAILSAALSSVLPIVVYFGKIPTHDLITIPFVLLSIIFYFNFVNSPSRANIFLLTMSLLLSHLSNWAGYYTTPLFFIHYLLFTKRPQKLFIASIFPIFSLCMFTIHLGHVKWLTGSFLGGGLTDIFLDRLNITDKPIDYSLFNFLKLQARYLTIYFTRPVLLLSAAAAIWTLLQIKKGHLSKQVQLIVMLALFGVSHSLIFRNISFIHDYIIIYLWPFLVITASAGFFQVTDSLKFLSRRQVIFLSILLLIQVSTERLKFTKALLSSSGFYPGFQLGKIISQKTQSGEKVLVLSPDFKRYFEVFTNFYADRVINYQLITEEELQGPLTSQNYKLVVAIPSRDTPQALIDVLQNQYQPTKIDQFIIFDLHESKTKGKISFHNYPNF